MAKLWVKSFTEGSDGKPIEIGSTGVYDVPDEAKANVIAKADAYLTTFNAPDAPAGGAEVAPAATDEEAAPPE